MKIQWKSTTIPHFLAERRSIFFSVETQVRVSLNCWVTSTIWCPAPSIQAVRDLLLWVWQLILPRILRHDRWYYKRKFFIHVRNLSSSQLTLCCDILNNLNYTTAQGPNLRKGGRNSLPRLSDLENQYRRKYWNFWTVKTIFPANCKISWSKIRRTAYPLNSSGCVEMLDMFGVWKITRIQKILYSKSPRFAPTDKYCMCFRVNVILFNFQGSSGISRQWGLLYWRVRQDEWFNPQHTSRSYGATDPVHCQGRNHLSTECSNLYPCSC